MPKQTHNADREAKKPIANGLYLLFVSVVLGISVLAYQTLSFSWFTSNAATSADGFHIAATSGDISILSIDTYSVTAINSTTYTFTTDNPPLVLPRYDPAGIGYLEYQPAVVVKVVCEVSANNLSLLLRGSQTSNLYAIDNSMSNVAVVRTAQPATPTTVSASAESQALVNPSQVNEATGEVLTKNAANLGALSAGTNTVWFVIEYNSELMPLINEALLQQIDLAGQDVMYQSDLILTVLSSDSP